MNVQTLQPIHQFANPADESGLGDLRVQALGKKGEISLEMRELAKMAP